MEIIKNPTEKDILKAINILKNGGVVLYPTDTVYGLAANIFDEDAIVKIYEIKQRDFNKPLSILVSSVDAISNVANISLINKKILNKYLPGPYTFILNKSNIVPKTVTSGLNQVGVRVPDNEIACKLASIFPITTTSANLSEKEVLSSPFDILNQLNTDIDLVLDVGVLKSSKPSQIIDLTTNKAKLINR